MKTKLFCLTVLCIIWVSVNAQTKSADKPFNIGIGAMAALPVGDVSSVASLAWGFDLLGEYHVSPTVGLTISAGYVDWIKKSGYSGNWGIVPVLAGAKIYGGKIYGSLQAGVSFATESGGGNAFTYAPGVGLKISDKLDLLLKYEAATQYGYTISVIGLRLGIRF